MYNDLTATQEGNDEVAVSDAARVWPAFMHGWLTGASAATCLVAEAQVCRTAGVTES